MQSTILNYKIPHKLSLVPRPLFSVFICGGGKKGLVDFSATTNKNGKKRSGNETMYTTVSLSRLAHISVCDQTIPS